MNFVKQENEEILTGDKAIDFIILKPYTYALIKDPVLKVKGEIQLNEHHQVKVKFGEKEIRTFRDYPEPFPLYPGESLLKIDKLTAIPRDCALKLRANKDFVDAKKNERKAGDEWQIMGPFIYEPRIEEDILQLQEPIIVDVNKAIKLRAKYACKDIDGKDREAGEEWIIKKPGQYMLRVNEVYEGTINGYILTDRKAIQLMSTKTFVDVYEKERRAGEEWLVTKEMASVHICDVFEKLVQEVQITVLKSDEFCYLVNPWDGKANLMGKKVLLCGPKAFFLQPGEELDGGIRNSFILGDDEALLLSAIENYTEVCQDKEVRHVAGDRWLMNGPCSYVPPVEVNVIEKRKAIPMDQIEGVYVRDVKTGAVRVEKGHTYLLQAHEELVPKVMSETVEGLVKTQGGCKRPDKSKMVTFKVPFNSASQVYDYKTKEMRVCVGPDLVNLGFDEEFTLTHLSGKTPKQPGVIKTLYIMLGPIFSTDVVEVETSDHARLEMKLAFYWRFILDENRKELVFNVRDFIGDMCKAMGSRVRAIVASVPFDTFHKNSADYVRKAIFGPDTAENAGNSSTIFPSNGLEVFNVDIQSIEPKDKKTKESLDKTVIQAIQITTKMQEQEARRIADKSEQDEQAKLERLRLDNLSEVEKAKKKYLELKADSDAVKTKGQALAEAKAKGEASKISANANVTAAGLKAETNKIKEGAEITHSSEKNQIEYEHKKALSAIKIAKAKQLAEIEGVKFKKIMEAIGKQTLIEIANAGPEMQAQMLQSLGMKGYMLMGSNNPVNLFTAANGMVGPAGTNEAPKP